MLPQDISLNLCIIDENNSMHSGLLKLLNNNGNIKGLFYRENPETKKPLPTPDNVFYLSDFITIELDPKDKLILTLSGCNSRLQLYFQCDNDIYIFQQYITTKVRFRKSFCNPCVYQFEPLDSTISTIPPFSTSILPVPDNQGKSLRVTLQDIEKVGLSFEPDLSIDTLSADSFYKSFDSEGRVSNIDEFAKELFNKDIDKVVLSKLWPLILFPDLPKKTKDEREQFIIEKREIYKKVKLQWQLLTFQQWQNYPVLRSLVELLESDLVANSTLFEHFAHPTNVQTIAFNILLTLYYWDNDGASYVKGMIKYLLPFINSFIFDAPTDEKVTLPDQVTTVNSDEVESDIFWCFYQFYVNHKIGDLIHPSNQPQLKPLFVAVVGILENTYPDLLKLLYNLHAESLDFLLDDVTGWYTTSGCFTQEEILRLWISLISFSVSSSNFQFNQYFIISFLFAMCPTFLKYNPMNNQQFLRMFNETKKKKLDLNMLLKNAQKLILNIQQKRNPTPENSETNADTNDSNGNNGATATNVVAADAPAAPEGQ